MSRQSKIIFGLLAGLIILGFVTYVYLANKGAQPIQQLIPYPAEDSTSKTKESKIISQPSLPTADTTEWATYDGVHAEEKFEFKYPKNILTLDAKDETITLRHSIPLRHVNPCDGRDNPTTLEELTDVDISMQFMQGYLHEAISKNEPPEFISEYFYYGEMGSENLRLIPGFIDFIDIGSLHGYRVTSGVEGCGIYTYYFPGLQTGRMLVVKRTFGELTSLSTDSQKYRALPGVILPDEEEKIVHGILATFKELGTVGFAQKNTEFESAINAKNESRLKELLANRVWLLLEATECCGWAPSEQVIDRLIKRTWDFTKTQPVTSKIRQARPDLNSYVIGIGIPTSEENNVRLTTFLAYHVNQENKIDRIQFGFYR